jgi:AAA15 family ATPase/GTPase
MVNEYAAIYGIKIGWENRCTRRKPVPVPSKGTSDLTQKVLSSSHENRRITEVLHNASDSFQTKSLLLLSFFLTPAIVKTLHKLSRWVFRLRIVAILRTLVSLRRSVSFNSLQLFLASLGRVKISSSL